MVSMKRLYGNAVYRQVGQTKRFAVKVCYREYSGVSGVGRNQPDPHTCPPLNFDFPHLEVVLTAVIPAVYSIFTYP